MGLYPYKKHPPPFQGSGIIENHVLLKPVQGGRAYASQYTAMLLFKEPHWNPGLQFVFFVSKGDGEDALQVIRKSHILWHGPYVWNI